MIILNDLLSICNADTDVIIKDDNTDKYILTGTAYDIFITLDDNNLNREVQTVCTEQSTIVIGV